MLFGSRTLGAPVNVDMKYCIVHPLDIPGHPRLLLPQWQVFRGELLLVTWWQWNAMHMLTLACSVLLVAGIILKKGTGHDCHDCHDCFWHLNRAFIEPQESQDISRVTLEAVFQRFGMAVKRTCGWTLRLGCIAWQGSQRRGSLPDEAARERDGLQNTIETQKVRQVTPASCVKLERTQLNLYRSCADPLIHNIVFTVETFRWLPWFLFQHDQSRCP